MSARQSEKSTEKKTDFVRPMILLGCVIGMMFSSSAVFFSTIGLFVKPMTAEFGWGRTQITAAASAAALASALVTPLFGRLIDTVGARRVILVSAAGLAAAVAALWGVPRSFPLYIALALAIGVAGTGSTTFAYLSLLPAWFDRRLGLALAVATIGFGLGQMLGPLYGNALIRALGWRHAYAVLGLSVLVVAVPNALFLLRDKPSRPAGSAAPAGAGAGLTLREALGTPAFWCLAGSVTMITAAVTGCTVHLVPLLTDRGLPTAAAARMAAVFGAAMLLTRFVTGLLMDHVDAKRVGVVLFCGVATGLALLLAEGRGAPTVAGVALLGAGLGVEADLIPYVTRRVFGTRAYGVIYGFFFAAFNVGVVLGPLLMGASFDRLGGYGPGLGVSLALAAAAAGLLAFGLPATSPPSRRHDPADAARRRTGSLPATST